MSGIDGSLGDSQASPTLEITQDGRGGGMTYREGRHEHSLSWEFALEPAIVLVFGTPSTGWDAQNPWGAGRQEAIYTFIGEEVVRQKVPSGDFDLDLDAGVITILRAKRRRAVAAAQRAAARRTPRVGGAPPNEPGEPTARRSPEGDAWKRFTDSVAAAVIGSDASLGYDLSAIAAMSDLERDDAVDLLARRGEPGWREIEALGAIKTPASTEHLQRALSHRMSVRARLIAARALHARDLLPSAPDYEQVVVAALRALHRENDGLTEALEIAESLDSPRVRQGLLYAAYQRTPCAPSCAQLLLKLTGELRDDIATREMLDTIGEHNSSFARQHAFDALCARAKLEFRPDDDSD